jgi:O-antigen/teichoic acid export membrane protein
MLNIKELKKHKTLSSGIHYSVASTATSVIGMMVSILCMLFIGPEDMGIWQSVSIITPYFTFLQLGIQSGLNVDLPILLGNNNTKKAENYISTALFISLVVTSIILLVSIIGVTWLTINSNSKKLIIAAAGMFLTAINESVTIHLLTRFRSARSFNILANIYWAQALAMLLLVILVFKYGLYGFIGYTIASSTLKTILMIIFRPFKNIKPKFDIRVFKHLFKLGIILMGFGQVRNVAQSVPKWFILLLGGTISVGLFSPALAVVSVMSIVPNQITQFFQPQMGYKYGRNGDASSIWSYSKKSIIYLPLIALPLSGFLCFIEPWLISTLFPKYIESVVPIQIITIGSVFSTSYVTHNVLYTVKAYREAAIYSFIELLGYIALPCIFYYLFGISLLNSVALGISTIYAVLYVLNYFLVKSALLSDRYNTIRI